MRDLRRVSQKVNAIISTIDKLEGEVLLKEICTDNVDYQARGVPISKILDYISGNSGLTEETIYMTLQREGNRYPVLSGATLNVTRLGTIPQCDIKGNELKLFINREGLLVARKGKAGATKFLPKGAYTLNDDAYILYLKDSCPYKISLKWLSIQCSRSFFKHASSSDNGTWNMSGFFNNVKIDIPKMQDQERVVMLWDKAEKRLMKMRSIQSKFESLCAKVISIA